MVGISQLVSPTTFVVTHAGSSQLLSSRHTNGANLGPKLPREGPALATAEPGELANRGGSQVGQDEGEEGQFVDFSFARSVGRGRFPYQAKSKFWIRVRS